MMITVIKNTHNQSAIDYAKNLLEKCESGEVVEVTALEELSNGNYIVHGSSLRSRTHTAGMLLDAAITRLKQE